MPRWSSQGVLLGRQGFAQSSSGISALSDHGCRGRGPLSPTASVPTLPSQASEGNSPTERRTQDLCRLSGASDGCRRWRLLMKKKKRIVPEPDATTVAHAGHGAPPPSDQPQVVPPRPVPGSPKEKLLQVSAWICATVRSIWWPPVCI
jgi:hypothetical protein